MRTRIIKTFTAVTAVTALFTLTSPPAGAAGPFTFVADAGTFEIQSAGPFGDITADWSNLPPNPCTGGGAGFFDLDLQVGPAIFGTAQTRVQPGSSAQFFYQDGATQLGVSLRTVDPADVLGAPDGGTITVNSPPPHTLTQEVWFLLSVSEVLNAPNCIPDVVCEDLVLVFDNANTNPLVGDYTGTIYPTPTSTIDDLGGVGAAFTYGPCDPDFAASFQAQPVTLSGVDLTYP